jgi:hypothetical protein
MATVTITGIDEVMRNLRAYADQARAAAGVALHEEARAIEEVSVTQYVPVDLGGLRRDHAFVDEAAKVEGSKVSVTFGYRGPYAAAVHENPRAGKTGGVSPSGRRYKHWATTGGWKFLELPLLQAENGMLGRLASRIRDIVGGRLAATFYGG